MPLVNKSAYKYVEKMIRGQNVSAIMLLEPEKWKGFIFTYTGGKFSKPDETGRCEVFYDFSVIENKMDISDAEMQGEEFTKLLGDIFVDIIEYAYDNNQVVKS